MFDPSNCNLNIWCGKGDKPNNYRTTGTRFDCLKVGYGRGYWDSKRQHMDHQDLDNIPYLTKTFKQYLINMNIHSLPDFINLVRSFKDYNITKAFLEEHFISKNKFNRIVLFLYDKGIPINKLPQCKD